MKNIFHIQSFLNLLHCEMHSESVVSQVRTLIQLLETVAMSDVPRSPPTPQHDRHTKSMGWATDVSKILQTQQS